MIEEITNGTKARCTMQALTVLDQIARDHIDDLRREARQARLAAKARRHQTRRPRPRPA
jgi:hypothetical protein